MNGRMRLAGLLTLTLGLLLPLNTGCDRHWRNAAGLLDDVADELHDIANLLDDRHDRDAGDWFDDVLDDVEDWFD